MDTHVRITAWIRILWSALNLIPALIFLLAYGGIAIIIAVFTGAAVAYPIIAIVGAFLALVFSITALPGLITGWGLLTYQPWARIINVVLSALDLFHFPIGTAWGTYSIWVMAHPETVALFEGGHVPGRYPSHF